MREFPKKLREKFEDFNKLDSPARIQDFLNKMPMNFGGGGDTCRSPLMVLRERKAHCIEGALLAAAALWYHGARPLLLDLATDQDDDHVVALFKKGGQWGAVSKTNHSVLRYRDPIFKNVRELALSYFNEYFLDDGRKTLRKYSRPFSLLVYEDDWLISSENLWAIPEDLDNSPHFNILGNLRPSGLRAVDQVEIDAGQLEEWKKQSG